MFGTMSVTVQLPAEAVRWLQGEEARRGISIDDVIAELASQLPAAAVSSGHRLSFIGVGASDDNRPIDVRRDRADLAEQKLTDGL